MFSALSEYTTGGAMLSGGMTFLCEDGVTDFVRRFYQGTLVCWIFPSRSYCFALDWELEWRLRYLVLGLLFYLGNSS